MTPSDRDSLLKDEIIEATQWIEKFLERQTEETFIADEMVASAVMYKLQSIGEVVKRLSEDFKASRNIPLKQIAGMRDVLAHDYAEVDRVAVWKTATKNMPELVKELG